METQFIRRLVRDTLGCTCPDEVFERIELLTNTALNNELTNLRTMVIGQRLLIHLWETNDPTRIQTVLPWLVSAGRALRDHASLNRYRAVIVTDDLDSIGNVARRIFNRLEDRDEKIHLHVIDRQDVVDLLG
jgi:hypothetical protein